MEFTLDFETGDLRGWTKTGTAFDYQPILGDNPTARRRGQPSKHQGRYWIGGFEKWKGVMERGQVYYWLMQDNRENTKYNTAPLRVKGRLDPFSIHLGLVWRDCSILGVSCVSDKNETLDWLMHPPYRLRT